MARHTGQHRQLTVTPLQHVEVCRIDRRILHLNERLAFEGNGQGGGAQFGYLKGAPKL
jgi:hypothetical protein